MIAARTSFARSAASKQIDRKKAREIPNQFSGSGTRRRNFVARHGQRAIFPTAPPAQNSRSVPGPLQVESMASPSATQYPVQSQSPTPAMPHSRRQRLRRRVAGSLANPVSQRSRRSAHAFRQIRHCSARNGEAHALDIDVGNVFIRTDATGQVSYHVRIETDGNEGTRSRFSTRIA